VARIPSDTSSADFVDHVFFSCGQKAQVVNVPAANLVDRFPSLYVILPQA